MTRFIVTQKPSYRKSKWSVRGGMKLPRRTFRRSPSSQLNLFSRFVYNFMTHALTHTVSSLTTSDLLARSDLGTSVDLIAPAETAPANTFRRRRRRLPARPGTGSERTRYP